MEEKQSYTVDITPEAEIFYLQLLEYLYQTHSENSAARNADAILDRMVHAAHRIELKGESMRKLKVK